VSGGRARKSACQFYIQLKVGLGRQQRLRHHHSRTGNQDAAEDGGLQEGGDGAAGSFVAWTGLAWCHGMAGGGVECGDAAEWGWTGEGWLWGKAGAGERCRWNVGRTCRSPLPLSLPLACGWIHSGARERHFTMTSHASHLATPPFSAINPLQPWRGWAEDRGCWLPRGMWCVAAMLGVLFFQAAVHTREVLASRMATTCSIGKDRKPWHSAEPAFSRHTNMPLLARFSGRSLARSTPPRPTDPHPQPPFALPLPETGQAVGDGCMVSPERPSRSLGVRNSSKRHR